MQRDLIEVGRDGELRDGRHSSPRRTYRAARITGTRLERRARGQREQRRRLECPAAGERQSALSGRLAQRLLHEPRRVHCRRRRRLSPDRVLRRVDDVGAELIRRRRAAGSRQARATHWRLIRRRRLVERRE